MTYNELITEVAKRLEWPEEKMAGIIGAILDVISTELKMNNPVAIDDFGALKTDIQPEYILVDPETKERYLMPPAMEVVFEAPFQENGEDSLSHAGFTPDEVLYNEVNSSFSQFEPALLNEGVHFPGVPEIIAGEPGEEETGEAPEYPYPQEKESEVSEYHDFQGEETLAPGHNSQPEESAEPEIPGVSAKPGIPRENTGSEIQEESAEPEIQEESAEPEIQEETGTGGFQVVALQAEATETAEATVQPEPVETAEPTVQPEPVETAEATGQTGLAGIKAPPPRHHPSRRGLQRNKRKSSVWIPIAGGIAIIVLSLFFFREGRNG